MDKILPERPGISPGTLPVVRDLPYCRDCGRYSPRTPGRWYIDRSSRTGGRPRLHQPCPTCGGDKLFNYSALFHQIGFVSGKTPPENFRKQLSIGYTSEVARHLYDTMRQARYDAQVNERTWENYFRGAELAWLRAKMAELTWGADCVDNTRVATVGKSRQLRCYNRQRAEGCCGSSDTKVTHGGKIYLMGFNYGH